jgi:hypothetical protein
VRGDNISNFADMAAPEFVNISNLSKLVIFVYLTAPELGHGASQVSPVTPAPPGKPLRSCPRGALPLGTVVFAQGGDVGRCVILNIFSFKGPC